MSNRTILLITESTLGRFDLSSGSSPSVVASWVRPSFASQSAGTLADAALRLGKSRRRQVYVVTTRCWTGSVALVSDVVSQVASADLGQMVALEAEAYSGISAFESASSIVPLPPDEHGDHRFWLTQIVDQDLRSIDEAVRQAGGKLVGIGHPAVATVDPPTSPTDTWQTLQNWDDPTLLIRGSGEQIEDFHSISSGLQSQQTLVEFETFFEGLDSDKPLRWIGSADLPAELAEMPKALGYQRMDTAAESCLKRWAAAWMRSRAKQVVGSPLITIPKRPMSREVSIAIAAGLGLIVMAACLAHHRHTTGQLAEMDAEVEVMEQQKSRLADGAKQLTTLRKQRDEAIAQTESLQTQAAQAETQIARAQRIIDRGSERWLSLVDSLVAVSNDDGWVREIQSTDGVVSIRGLAIDDAAAHRLAADLESSGAAGQWQILPASTSIDEQTNLTEFAIVLVAVSNETS